MASGRVLTSNPEGNNKLIIQITVEAENHFKHTVYSFFSTFILWKEISITFQGTHTPSKYCDNPSQGSIIVIVSHSLMERIKPVHS